MTIIQTLRALGSPVCTEAAKLIEDQQAELKARKEILDNIAIATGTGNCWIKALDWRQQLQDFAEDSDAHLVSHDLWKENRGKGIALYIKDGFYTAYYDDAGEMHGQADDDLPMFHVMLECDKPHRTCIHPLHLTAWVEHLASVFMP